jgi:hypothetical protein
MSDSTPHPHTSEIDTAFERDQALAYVKRLRTALQGLGAAVQDAHVGMDERNPACSVCRWLNHADEVLRNG